MKFSSNPNPSGRGAGGIQTHGSIRASQAVQHASNPAERAREAPHLPQIQQGRGSAGHMREGEANEVEVDGAVANLETWKRTTHVCGYKADQRRKRCIRVRAGSHANAVVLGQRTARRHV
eukprot:scaffold676_cov316-Pavlova_lutheri.AAC.46